MTPAKAQDNGKAKTSKAKAAKAEKDAGPKTYDFRGLELELPPELPGEILFDFADLEAQMRDGEDRMGPTIDLLNSLVGEQQVRKIRAKVGEDKLSLTEAFEAIYEVLNGVLEQYGLALGEVSASASS